MAAALELFSTDVRASEAVLRLSPGLVALRREAAVVEWRWAGPGASWTRRGPDGNDVFAPLVSLEVGADTVPPFTRHVVVFAAYAAGAETSTIGTSAAVRAAERDR